MHPGEALDRLRRIRNEYDAAAYALGRQVNILAADLEARQAAEREGITEPELRRCARHLQTTYIVRLFATFEALLLDYWQRGMGRRTRPQVRILIDRVADTRSIDPETRAAAHAVRASRNDIVHNALETAPINFAISRTALARFLSWLPKQGW